MEQSPLSKRQAIAARVLPILIAQGFGSVEAVIAASLEYADSLLDATEQPAPHELPEWIDGMLNRRTKVEGILRKVGAGAEPVPTDPAWFKDLATLLSVPDDVRELGGIHG